MVSFNILNWLKYHSNDYTIDFCSFHTVIYLMKKSLAVHFCHGIFAILSNQFFFLTFFSKCYFCKLHCKVQKFRELKIGNCTTINLTLLCVCVFFITDRIFDNKIHNIAAISIPMQTSNGKAFVEPDKRNREQQRKKHNTIRTQIELNHIRTAICIRLMMFVHVFARQFGKEEGKIFRCAQRAIENKCAWMKLIGIGEITLFSSF